MSDSSRNPGWAGEVGEFDQLTEADVRGSKYAGPPRLDGGHPGVAASLPFQIEARDPGAALFEGPYEKRFERILSRYPNRRAALLPTLSLAQEVRGHVSPETMDEVAELLGLSNAVVRGVASFYTMYNKRPVGRFLVQVCTNISCNLLGADEVLRAFLDGTGTEEGETSEDGDFTVIQAECLAACGFATCVQINERYFESVAPGDVPEILEALRARSGATASPVAGEAE